ncbi:MAG: glycosyltransferase family 2 protein [Halobacteriaceae archaeon]
MAVEQDHISTVKQAIPASRVDAEQRSADALLLDADSATDPVVSIVLPTLNEAAGIGRCMEQIHRAVEAMGIPTEVVLADSSTDGTADIAQEYGAIITEPVESGYGAAYRHAFEQVRGDYIVMADADCTYDFEELPKLLSRAIAEEADLVLGSRLNGEIEPGAMPALHQYVGNPILTTFLNAFYGAGVSDAHSGYRVLTREALETLDLRTTGMEFASEMIMEAGARDLTIAEVPIVYHERVGEATLDSFRDGWRHVRFMLLNAPGYLFSLPGVLMTLLGMGILAGAITDMQFRGVGLGPHSAIAGSLLTLLGVQVLGLGAFARVTANPIRRRGDPIADPLIERVRLEHGASLGMVIFAAGAGYGFAMLARWIESGFARLPLVMEDVAAMTAIVVGIQVVFLSFYLSAVAGD